MPSSTIQVSKPSKRPRLSYEDNGGGDQALREGPDPKRTKLVQPSDGDGAGEIEYFSDADDYSDDDGAVSDADSDVLDVRADKKRAEVERNKFLTSLCGRPADSTRKQKGAPRGPRKEAEVTGVMKMKLQEANRHYAAGHYDEAIRRLAEIIKHNSEVVGAWTLLATIYEDFDCRYRNRTYAVICKMFLCHLRPRMVQGWLDTADFALQDDEAALASDDQDFDAAETLRQARLERVHIARICYSYAINADRENLKARAGKADVCLELGQIATAAKECQRVLKHKPFDRRMIRNLAEASFDPTSHTVVTNNAKAAVAAYGNALAHCRAGGVLQIDEGKDGALEWIDGIIYAELLAALGDYEGAINAVSSLARWLLGRDDQTCWGFHTADDREWDKRHDRRLQIHGFVRDQHPFDTYGLGLPLELRLRLAVYRLGLQEEQEASGHLSWIKDYDDPKDPEKRASLDVTPRVVKDVASQFRANGRFESALHYYRFYMDMILSDDVDADALMQQGMCHAALGDDKLAEEFLVAATEADNPPDVAFLELAKIHERRDQHESAFVLVNEALKLEKARHDDEASGANGENRDRRFIEIRGKLVEKARRHVKGSDRQTPRAPVIRRPRVRRFADPAKRREFEQEMSRRLKEKFETCRTLKVRIQAGDEEAISEWMDAAEELTNDFRSFRKFYTWDSYAKFLGYGGSMLSAAAEGRGRHHEEMTAMAKRLHANLAPSDQSGETRKDGTHESNQLAGNHRGIPFSEWLDLFLEYALGLARARKTQEAYKICQSIRDSIVWKARDNMFLIHLTWASCAIHAGDEETCVAVARYFMRDMPFSSDGYRMHAALCRVCQSPSSWYNSGPAQKFVLRQIKIMDECLIDPNYDFKMENAPDAERPKELDVCLLVIYGHILFASASFSYALNYFHRANALDPGNLTVTLSIALCYIHWALKRQAENRQYMIMQGMTFMLKYYEQRLKSEDPIDRQEGHYNMARTYHLLGLHDLTIEYYSKVLEEVAVSERTAAAAGLEEEQAAVANRKDFVADTVFNLRTVYLVVGNREAALNITRRWLVL